MDLESFEPSATATAPTVDLFCPGCGYSLRGITSERCPECGLAIDRSSLAVSQIPWAHRRRVGRVRAYWRTVWFCTFYRNRLAGEIARPVSYSDAQRFRWLTVSLMILPAVLAWPFVPQPAVKELCQDMLLPEPLVPYLLPLMLLGCTISLLAITGIPSYFFHPGRLSIPQQNRAIALSYYTCAPLALTIALVYASIGLSFVASMVSERFFHDHATLIMASTIALPCAAFVLLLYFLLNASVLLKRATGAGVLRQAMLLVTMIASMALLGPVIVLGILWIAAYIYWLACG